jgi:hypothetical protein
MIPRPTISGPEFKARFAELHRKAAADDILAMSFIDIDSKLVPWLDTGIDLAKGEKVTLLSVGKTTLIGTGLSFGADFQLWFRIGTEGEVFRGTRFSHSFCAERSGRFFVASYFPGEWANRSGELAVPPEAYQQVSGTHSLVLIRWECEILEGLQRLAAVDDVENLISGEIERLNKPGKVPTGWHYLWFLGPAEIYGSCQDSGRKDSICCHNHNDVGLLQKDVVLPLLPDTRLNWSWRIDQLPSLVGEDSLQTHDYLSIAVEFDNGQDITYFWSSELPVGKSFRCPIPTWNHRETHVVIRSGPLGFGEWIQESRDLYADYGAFIEGDRPANIVRVWLIAVSFFQGGEGSCRYADISLSGNHGVTPIR